MDARNRNKVGRDYFGMEYGAPVWKRSKEILKF